MLNSEKSNPSKYSVISNDALTRDNDDGGLDEQFDEHTDDHAQSYSSAHTDTHDPIPGNKCQKVLSRARRRLQVLWSQLTLSEISGSLGDLGTLIPLLVALARQRSVFLAPALFWGGAANVLTGIAWDVPMCVQPMKSIAAVALAEGLTQSQVSAAGMWMGIFMTFLGVTGLIDFVNRIIPSTVVSGLQMGVGINLAMHGIGLLTKLTWVGEADSILLAVLVSLLSLYFLRETSTANRPHPVGVYLVVVGLLLAIVKLIQTEQLSSINILGGSPIAIWTLSDITSEDWLKGLTEGAIPQLPLTTLNSVISVCCLANSLYPSKTAISRKEVAVSVGIMNLICCPLGAMPSCHGAGGLAGQHKFGARHGASVVFLGIQKMLLAIIFGASALTLLDALPNAILGVMLAITGQELATTGLLLLTEEKEKIRQRTVVAMITTVVIVALHKTHVGALSGWLAHVIYGDGFTDFIDWTKGTTNQSEAEEEEEASTLFVQERTNTVV